MVVEGLLGVALEDFFRARAVAFGGGVGLAKVDDVLDAHVHVPSGLRLVRPKSMFIKMNIARAFAAVMSNILKHPWPLV